MRVDQDERSISARWATDEELAGAVRWFAAQIDGYVTPVAYAIARIDAGNVTFGHVNAVGAVRPLPAVVLAFVCGHATGTATYTLPLGKIRRAVDLLTPAEAATHIPHPNLWSWRDLLAEATESSRFRAFFLGNDAHPPSDDAEAEFFALALAP